jgi:hypothetical protein
MRTAESIEAFEERVIGPADACRDLAIRGALIEARGGETYQSSG